MVVAYLMTVTDYGWEDCLSAIKAVRSFVGPNYGFQSQLQEYQTTKVAEVYRTHTHSASHTHTHTQRITRTDTHTRSASHTHNRVRSI